LNAWVWFNDPGQERSRRMLWYLPSGLHLLMDTINERRNIRDATFEILNPALKTCYLWIFVQLGALTRSERMETGKWRAMSFSSRSFIPNAALWTRPTVLGIIGIEDVS
jgi:hypothetical protein